MVLKVHGSYAVMKETGRGSASSMSAHLYLEVRNRLLKGWRFMMHRLLGRTSVPGGSSSSLASFTFRPASAGGREIWRGKVEEDPGLRTVNKYLLDFRLTYWDTSSYCSTHSCRETL